MSKIEIFVWLNTFFAILGTFLNAKRVRFGFIIWMLTNVVFVIYNIYLHSYPQAALFGVYFGLALYGWINWGREQKETKTKETA